MYIRIHLAKLLFLGIIIVAGTITAVASEKVNITTEIPYVDIYHKGKTVRIERNQDSQNIIDLDYAITSRPCPPYCIQPMKLAGGVETIAELEVLAYLKKISAGDKSILVIDSREPKWLSKGMIPGAINIPWQQLYNKTASNEKIADIIQFKFGVAKVGGLLNFQSARANLLDACPLVGGQVFPLVKQELAVANYSRQGVVDFVVQAETESQKRQKCAIYSICPFFIACHDIPSCLPAPNSSRISRVPLLFYIGRFKGNFNGH